MRSSGMNFGQAPMRMVQAGAALAAAVLIAGCGSTYSSVITPVNPSGPASQVESYAVVVSSPSATSKAIASVIDYSGDTILASATIGLAPKLFTLDSTGSTGYTYNSDDTITTFPASTSLLTKNVSNLTLTNGAQPANFYTPSAGMWVPDLNGNTIDVMTGSPLSVQYQIQVPATPVMVMSSTSVGQRDFAISQVADSNGYDCNTAPTAVTSNGMASSIELATYTVSNKFSLDPTAASGTLNARCPVYAVEGSSNKRLFVLNRGSDTVSVINTQTAALDSCTPFAGQDGRTVTCHPILPLSANAATATGVTPTNSDADLSQKSTTGNAGPVYAEYNSATQTLVVANYDGGTISIIDVSLDTYGNDSATFGTTYTVKVGNTATPYPSSVTVLHDGSRAYTANQGDGTSNGTVSVVNLTSHTLSKTLDVTGFPRTVVSTQNSTYGKVYAAAPNSPYLTIISTTSDEIDTALLTEGNVLDVRTSTQDGNSTNYNLTSYAPGHGSPCYLPPNHLATDTLTGCQTLPY